MTKVSVVIPSHNRRESVLLTLESLARQTLAANTFEVIVALDATIDGSDQAIAARPWPFRIRTVIPQGRGAASARNAGAALAIGDRLVFLDDDIVVDPEFLEAHLSDEPDSVIVGQSAPTLQGKDWFSASLQVWWENRFIDMSKPGYRFAFTDVMSGNLSLRREIFDRVGGFDAGLHCREDYEFGLRLLEAGARLSYVPSARGLHFDRSDLRRNLARARAEGIADVQIARKHPHLTTQMMFSNLKAPYRSARVLRFALFRVPRLGRLCRSALLPVIPWLETLGMRRSWLAATRAVWAYSYYGGAAETLGSVDALDDFRDRPPLLDRRRDWLDLDLVEDPQTLLARYRQAQPKAVAINLGDWALCTLTPRAGSEPLSEPHVSAALHDHNIGCGEYTFVARALPPVPTVDPAGVSPYPQERTDWSLGSVDVKTWNLRLKDRYPAVPLRLLVQFGPVPVGWVWLTSAPEPGQFWQTLRKKILNDPVLCQRLRRELLLPRPAPDESSLPAISVVICTRDRTAMLRRCLAAIMALDYPDFEILVVDNSPTTEETANFVRGLPNVRYLREDRQGLDWARNCGLREARNEIIAYTDDDTQADPLWLRGLAAAFSEPGVGAVTGLVLPMELDGEEQVYFEDHYGGMGKGFDPWVRYRSSLRDRDLLWSSACGVGANMAFDRQLLIRIGSFDPALDVGTATRGGGDIEMFHRVLASGAGFAYAPEAFVWHQHRSGVAALRRQLSDNGSGFAAYLLTAARNRTVARHKIVGFALRDWGYAHFIKRMLRPGPHPRSLILAEFSGAFRGYRSYRTARRVAEQQISNEAAKVDRSNAD
jgi:glycosyltransferase involved in cell wall biosynthesis